MPPAGGGAGPPAELPQLDPLTLRFDSPSIELRYRAARFRDEYAVHSGIILAASLLSFAVYLKQEWGAKLDMPVDTVFELLPALFARSLVHFCIPPESGVNLLCSLCLLICSISCLAMLSPHVVALWSGDAATSAVEASPTRTSIMFYTVTYMNFPLLLHAVQMPFGQRLWVLSLFMLAQVLDAATAEDAVSEALVLLIGSAVGHTLELRQRRAYVKEQELQLARKDSIRADVLLNRLLSDQGVEVRFLTVKACNELSAVQQSLDGNAAQQTLPSAQSTHAALMRCLELLDGVQWIHEQTLDWAHIRDMFMQIQQGQYVASHSPTHLKLLLERVIEPLGGECDIQVNGQEILTIDAQALQLQLEEACFNAVKYKEVDSKVWIRTQTEQDDAYSPLWLHITVDSENRRSVPALTKKQCLDAVNGSGSHFPSIAHRLPKDGIGLRNVSVVAAATSGEAWLSTYIHPQTGRAHTIFHTRQPASRATDAEIEEMRGSGQETRGSEQPVVRKRPAKREAKAQIDGGFWGEEPPYCLGLEDSEASQGLLLSVFDKLGASSASRAMGSTEGEQKEFADLALGAGGLKRPADVVIISQSLNVYAQQRLMGTEVAKSLSDAGFNGFIVVHSALGGEDLRALTSLPYVHHVSTKGHSATRFAVDLAAAYMVFCSSRRRSRTGDGEETTPSVVQPPLTVLQDTQRASSSHAIPSCNPGISATHESGGTPDGILPSRVSMDSVAADVSGQGGAAGALGFGAQSDPLRQEVDFTHLADFGGSHLSRVIAPFYDRESKRGGHSLLQQLQETVERGGDITDIAHRLTGDATMGGATSLARQVATFRATYPSMSLEQSHAFLASMRCTLEQTKEKLLPKG